MELLVPELAEISAKLDTIIELLRPQSGSAPIRSTPRTARTGSTIMTVAELVQYVGIGRSTVCKFTSGRILPFLKIGRQLLFRPEEIDDLMGPDAQEALC